MAVLTHELLHLQQQQQHQGTHLLIAEHAGQIIFVEVLSNALEAHLHPVMGKLPGAWRHRNTLAILARLRHALPMRSHATHRAALDSPHGCYYALSQAGVGADSGQGPCVSAVCPEPA